MEHLDEPAMNLCLYGFLCIFGIQYMYQGRRRRGGSGGLCPRTFKSGGGAQVGLSPPTFGQTKCSNLAIFSYFVVKKCKFFLARFARQLYFINIFKP